MLVGDDKHMRKIKFIDFCAGIGGFRLGLENLGWECVYSCELDEYCEKTYSLNFGHGFNERDIFDVNPETLPYFDVLCAGFPCQPFSIAGKQLGFEDPRGEIFNQIIKIAKVTEPSVIFLENVSNLVNHNKGKTFQAIKKSLEDLNYKVHFKVLDSSLFGVPQRRPRVYILAVAEGIDSSDFTITEKRTDECSFRAFIEKGDFSIPITDKWQEYIDLYTGVKELEQMSFEVPKTRVALERISKKANLSDCVLQIRSSGIRAFSLDEPLPTFAVSNSGGGAMIPVYTGERRHLNITEIKRIMGFPEQYKFNVARTHAIKQLANAVCPPVISSIGKDLEKIIASSNHLLRSHQTLLRATS